jgi:hypothetical protein
MIGRVVAIGTGVLGLLGLIAAAATTAITGEEPTYIGWCLLILGPLAFGVMIGCTADLHTAFDDTDDVMRQDDQS